MKVDRRRFLIGAGASVAGLAVLKEATPAVADSLSKLGKYQSWADVRRQFDSLSPDVIHMSSFFLVSHPKPVRDLIEKHKRAIDADPLTYIEENAEKMQDVIQASAAEYLGGKPEEVAVTNSTTMGLTLVYQGLQLDPGTEILTTAHDHFVHHESIRLAAARAGATFRKIALFDDIKRVSSQDIVDRIAKGISPKTRVLGITWVHSGTGLKLPLREIAAAVAAVNAKRAEADKVLIVVDGVHGFGVEDVAAAETGVDFFIAGTHKWMFGPRGTGIVWAKAENWKKLRMVFPAFARETFAAWATGGEPGPMRAGWIAQGGFHAFEYEWAMPAAFEFHRSIGRPVIAERIHSLNDQCKEGLAAMKHVELHTPPGSKLSSGIIAFEVKGMRPDAVVRQLHTKGVIASTSPYPVSYARLAPSLINTPEEVETVLRLVRELV